MEFTPFHQRGDIFEYCIDNGIVVLSDNPLAKDVYSKRPDLVETASSLNITVQEVCNAVLDCSVKGLIRIVLTYCLHSY